MLNPTNGTLPSSKDEVIALQQDENADEEEADDHVTEPVKVLEEKAFFDEVVVWDHETTTDESVNPYGKGVEEWIAFAEKVQSEDGKGRLLRLG